MPRLCNTCLKAMDRFLGDFSAAIDGLLGQKRTAHARKQSRSEGGKGPADGRNMTEHDDEWVTDLVKGVATVVATKNAERFQAVERRVDALEVAKAEYESKHAALQQKQEEQATIIAELQRQLAASAGHPGGSQTSRSESVPWELRTAAIIGSLGWDVPDLDLLAAARDVLQRAGVDGATWEAVHPGCRPGGKGSTVTLLFKDPNDLSIARAKVRALACRRTGARSAVWLDAQKTRAELRPSRQMRALVEATKTVLGTKAGEQEVTRDDRVRTVSINGVASAFLKHSSLVWTTAGCALLDEGDRDWITALVEGTQ